MKSRKTKRIYKIFSVIMALLLILSVTAVTAFAVEVNDPIESMNKLVDLVFALIRCVGLIMSGWGLMEFSGSQTAHDGAGKIRGISLLVSGIIVVFGREILAALGITF